MKNAVTIQLLLAGLILSGNICAMDKKQMLEACRDVQPNEPSGSCNLGDRPLHLAAIGSNLPMVATLLSQGAHPGAYNAANRLPIHRAVEAGNTATLLTLLNYPHGRVIDIGDGTMQAKKFDGEISLHTLIAAEAGSPFDRFERRMKLILQAQPALNINAQTVIGHTPLHYAVLHDATVQIIKFLRKNGADGTIKDYMEGRTPLNLALHLKRTDEQIEALVEPVDEKSATTEPIV